MADESVEAWAQREVSALTPVAAPKGIKEADIRTKVAAGLTRQQAIEVLNAQQAHDERLEQEEASPVKKGKKGSEAEPGPRTTPKPPTLRNRAEAHPK